MNNQSIDLDVDAPEKVESVLRAAADRFNESSAELSAAWTDPGAGKVWEAFATILNRAADACERARVKHGV